LITGGLLLMILGGIEQVVPWGQRGIDLHGVLAEEAAC
jgi:hypothetical protein